MYVSTKLMVNALIFVCAAIWATIWWTMRNHTPDGTLTTRPAPPGMQPAPVTPVWGPDQVRDFPGCRPMRVIAEGRLPSHLVVTTSFSRPERIPYDDAALRRIEESGSNDDGRDDVFVLGFCSEH